jgi:tyrosyl-tRNA synthetase
MTAAILDELDARGLVQDVTDREGLAKELGAGVVPFYVGYDPTAPSLHAGNLVPTTVLVRLQRAGHKPIILVGGATGMIGDPSGRSDERQLLDTETLEANLAGIREQLSQFVSFGDGPTDAVIVNNADWFKPISYIEFLRDVGKHLTLNYMMAKDSVRSRLEDRDQGISYTEFSYMLLQAYDFVHLAREHGCRLQAGGSDQWGNITAGTELFRKLGGGHQIFGLTSPLLLDSRGEKMGKTSTGDRVWLDPERTSPYAFYQYWFNVADADVRKLLLTFSFRTVEEINELADRHDETPGKREGQRALAEDMTTWVHGEDALRKVVAASRVMFGGSLEELDDADLAPLLDTVPSSELARSELDAGIELLELLVRTELAQSKGAARRNVSGGGVYINNVRVEDIARSVTAADLGTETMIVLRSGKKKYHIIKLA